MTSPRRKRFAVIVSTILFSCMTPLAAHAQGFVVGGGIAQDCYKAARDHTYTATKGIEICNASLDMDQLDRRDRAATIANRGILKMRIQQHALAIKDFDRAITLSPDLVEIHINRGAALVALSEFEQAIEALEIGLTTDRPNDRSVAYYNRALAYDFQGDYQSAYADYKQALTLNPDFENVKQQLERFTVVSTTPSH